MILTAVDLENIKVSSPEEKLYNDLALIDRATYDGKSPWSCLCGQLASRYPDYVVGDNVLFFLYGKYPEVSRDKVDNIFRYAATDLYSTDVDIALKMAETVLGLNSFKIDYYTGEITEKNDKYRYVYR